LLRDIAETEVNICRGLQDKKWPVSYLKS